MLLEHMCLLGGLRKEQLVTDETLIIGLVVMCFQVAFQTARGTEASVTYRTLVVAETQVDDLLMAPPVLWSTELLLTRTTLVLPTQVHILMSLSNNRETNHNVIM